MARGGRESRYAAEPDIGSRSGFGPREARALFESITQHDSRRCDFVERALVPAMSNGPGFATAYARYRRFASAPPVPCGCGAWNDLFTLYALSRVFERLILGVQARIGLSDTCPPRLHALASAALARDALIDFFGAFGMAPMQVQSCYHPFFHEVVRAERDPALGEAILVEEEIWPGLWFGDLVFARAGVGIRCGPRARLDPGLATGSILYFAWNRARRPARDLSHGWGSNSQWATAFRRDYADGAVLRYNVDGRAVLGAVTPPDPESLPQSLSPDCMDLTEAKRIELLTYRCFVRTGKSHHDRWPFDDTCTEPAPGPDWIW